jgi:hypothetical protein
MASKRSSRAIKVAIVSGAFLLGVVIINKLDTIVDYFTPHKQRTDEIKKIESKPSLTSIPSPTPEKIFVLEKSARELVSYLGSLPSFPRGFIVKNSYEGRWVRWKGKVEDIRSVGDNLYIFVIEKDARVFIISSKECFPKIVTYLSHKSEVIILNSGTARHRGCHQAPG